MNLAQAVAANDIATVKDLLQSGQDPNQTFPCSPRQSNYAVQPLAGHAHNFEPDDVLYGATPLNLAVLNANKDIVCALLAAGADVNKKDGRGRTPLLCAVYGLDTLTITPANLAMISQTLPGHLMILRECILPHPSITLSTLNAPQDEIKGITPLCLASYLGKEVVVRCLLEGGKVDVDATDRKGATALMYAARDRHMSVVKTLLQHGASPDQTDSNGWSSIQYGQMYPEIVQMFEEALRCKRPEVLQLLTPPDSPEPSPTLPPERRNKTPLPPSLSQSLVRYPLYYSKLSSLLSSLPSGNSDTNGGPGSLSLQSHIKSSADAVQAQQMQKTTHLALLEAIRLGDHLSLQSLLMAPPARTDAHHHGPSSVALVNHHDPQTGLTPLHHALRTRPLPSLETVKILYQAGADMNAQSHYGRTALHHLCRFSLEHALTPVLTPEEIMAQQAAAAANAHQHQQAANSSTAIVGINGGINGVPKSPDEARPRRRPRDRTETAGSTTSNHHHPHHLVAPTASSSAKDANAIVSSAASTTSSNDLSTGASRGGAFGQLPDMAAVANASPEEIKRISNHLAKCCKLLLRLGSLVNIADRHGNTPLHFAVEYGGVLEVVQVLVDEGADIDQRNTKGLKPLDVVRGEQSEEMRKILEIGRRNAAGANGEETPADGNTAATNYPPIRDSILKPLNLPETLHEVDFQFNQVLQNLEHYQNHTSVSIESSLQYITDQILLGWSPENLGANGESGQSQEEYNASLVASLENLKYELETTYELLTITEEQYRDVVTFYEAELDGMTKQNLTVLTSYDSEKTKVAGLFAVYTRLIEQLEELEAENEGLKKELEEKKRRGLASLGRLVHGAMGGQWSGVRNGTQITLPAATAAVTATTNTGLGKESSPSLKAAEAMDEEQQLLSSDHPNKLEELPRPSMVLVSQDALSQMPSSADGLTSPIRANATAAGDKDGPIPRPSSPTLTILSSDQEPTLHTIALLSQKVSLLEQELSSKTYDIKERDLLVGELTDLIEEQTRAFDNEVKNREERIDSLMKLLGRAENGEQVQTLVDELAVKIHEEESAAKSDHQQVSSPLTPTGGMPAGSDQSISGGGDWSFLLKTTSSSSTSSAKDDLAAAVTAEEESIKEEDIVAKLKHELELSRAQTARLEMANASLKERWQTAMHELSEIRLSEAANPPDGSDRMRSESLSSQTLSSGGGLGSDEAGDDAVSIYAFSERNPTLLADRGVTTVWVPKRPNDIQDEPLVLTIGEDGSVQPDLPSLQEIELTFEILMANLAEISRDIEDAELRVKECSKAKVLIYQRILHLDEMQKSLDESVDRLVSHQPVKADDNDNGQSTPSFVEDQLKLQAQVDRLMAQAEEATELYATLKEDLAGFKKEKQVKLKELDTVRELMRKIGPQELLRGLLAKLESAQPPDDTKAAARRAAIQAAVQQGMELAAEMAQEEEEKSRDRVASHLWRNSCSVVDEGDVQDAINSRLSTASIDYYTQSCSISDHKLFIQSLCSTLYALQMTTTHQITSLKTSLAESKASLVLADQELSNLNDQIAGLYDEVGTLRSMLRGLQQELERLIQHRKAEVEKVWEIVGEVKITTGGGLNRSSGGGGSGDEDDEEGSVSSADSVCKELTRKTSIQSRVRETSSYLSLSNHYNNLGSSNEAAAGGEGSQVEGGEGSTAEDVARLHRSLSISRAERASVLRRISSPPQVTEKDEEGSISNGGGGGGVHPHHPHHPHGSPSRTHHHPHHHGGRDTPTTTMTSRGSHDFSDTGSDLDRHALISAEMEKLRSVHLHLLSTITEYKRRISVVKDRNLKLVATLLDRERVRLWTADGQDEIISAIVGHGATSGPANSTNAVAVTTQATLIEGTAATTAAASAAAVPTFSHAGTGSTGHHLGSSSAATASTSTTITTASGPSSTSTSTTLYSSTFNPGLAQGSKKTHHMGLTAAEDGIKLLRCQLERIRQCEMARFTDMGAGLMGIMGPGASMVNSSNLFPLFSSEPTAAGSALRARTSMMQQQQRSSRVTFGSVPPASVERGTVSQGPGSTTTTTAAAAAAVGPAGGVAPGNGPSSSPSSRTSAGQGESKENSGGDGASGEDDLTPAARHAFSKFEATMYSDLENRYGKGF